VVVVLTKHKLVIFFFSQFLKLSILYEHDFILWFHEVENLIIRICKVKIIT